MRGDSLYNVISKLEIEWVEVFVNKICCNILTGDLKSSTYIKRIGIRIKIMKSRKSLGNHGLLGLHNNWDVIEKFYT